MFIAYAEISGHNQFTLPQIKTIKIDFTSSVQIIIGSNGSGKSTLLRELTPLPPASGDYQLGGYKKLIIIDKGNRFYLENFYGKPVKHTFELNGENLNISGKETEQKKLVKDYFGITPSLAKLMTGEIQFSRLGALARRDWLMSVSGINFDYAMQFLNRVKDFNREASAVAKSIAGREADEIEKLSQIGDVSALKDRAKILTEAITKLMRLETEVKTRSDYEIRMGVNSKLTSIKEGSSKILHNLPRKLVYRFDHIPDIETLRAEIQALTQQSERYREELKELYRKKEDLIKLAEKTNENGTSLDDERSTIESLLAQAKEMETSCNFFFENKEVQFSSLDDFENSFRIACMGYVNNTSLTFTSERYKELQSLEAEITQTATEINRQLNGVIHAIKHQQEMPNADCPDCGKHFKIGNAENKLIELEEEKIHLENQLLIQEDRKAISDTALREFMEFTAARRDLLLMLDAADNVIVRKLKEEILLKEPKGIGSRGLLDILRVWRENIDTSRRIQKLREEASNRSFALKHIEEINELRKHYEGTQLDDIDLEINRLFNSVEEAIKETKLASKLVNETTSTLNDLDELFKLRTSINDDLSEFSKHHEQEAIKKALLILQTELAGIQTTISKVDSIQHTVNNLSSYREEHEQSFNGSKKLLEMISPNTGLIAEYVMGFLEDFTSELNRFLSDMWEYEMEILPCRMDSEEVDYKFPVRLQNDPKLRKDIIETSKGQLHVIDMVIALVILSSNDKTICPLYLDEPGEGFDEKHSENFVRFVKSYLEQGYSEQVFMISHDFAGHASFTHAETLVLHDDNLINKPPRYNKHVQIAYN